MAQEGALARVQRAAAELTPTGKKWLHARIKQPLHAAGHPNQGLSCNFMAGAQAAGSAPSRSSMIRTEDGPDLAGHTMQA